VLLGGGGGAAEHAGEFGDPLRFGQEVDARGGASSFDFLGDEIMRVGMGGDWCKVRDAEHLPVARDLFHLFPNDIRGLASDVGIDFVEHQDRDLVLSGQNGLESEHDPGEFSRGGDGAQGSAGFPGIGGEKKFRGVDAGGGEPGDGCGLRRESGDGGVEVGLFEAERGQFLVRCPVQSLGKLVALGGQVGPGSPDALIQRFQFSVETGEFLVALFESLKFVVRVGAKLNDFFERCPVFALEGVKQIDPFFEFHEAARVGVDAVGVTGEFTLELLQIRDGLLLCGEEALGVRIELSQFLERATEGSGQVQNRLLVVVEQADGSLAEFQQFGTVAGSLVFVFELGFFIGLEAGTGDLCDLETEQIELSRVGLLIDDEVGFGVFELGALLEEAAELGPGLFEIAEGVEDGELPGRMKEGLVIVGTMDIDQPLPDRCQGGEGSG